MHDRPTNDRPLNEPVRERPMRDEMVAGGPRRGATRVYPPPSGRRPRGGRPEGRGRKRSRARSLAGIVAAVTASGLAIGTGVAIDRLLLPEIRDETTSAASETDTREPALVPPGPQSDTPAGAGTGDGTGAPAGAAPPPTAEQPTPPLKAMRDPSRSTSSPPASKAPSKAPSGGSSGGSGGSGSSGSSGGAPSTAGQTGPEAAVVSLTNAERAKAGCGALRVDQRLVTAARRHSADMAANNYFSHTSQNGASPWDRMAAAGYNDAGAENIAKGYATAKAVVEGWMNSPGHRANILNCDLRAIGVGKADGPGGPYWTQNFGRK